MTEYSARGMDTLIDYLYNHADEFRLLLDASYGTRFHRFIDEMVQVEVEYTYKYIALLGRYHHTGFEAIFSPEQ